MTRTTPEVPPPLQTFASGRLIRNVRFNVHQAHIHDGSSGESGFRAWNHMAQKPIPYRHRGPLVSLHHNGAFSVKLRNALRKLVMILNLFPLNDWI
ncbi:hypothetical protein AVEN_82935-1 [Araneus ventricosus]|uniref:Uncharacterized protein n=1 Tax=Araneus ventricosus TaxID=182803 RepID=A0A4Y2CUU3_ARAVE|nr:hypothetical protein AVEN_82935-1 [Araneus ventricosus]